MQTVLNKRLAALEAMREAAPRSYTAEEIEAAQLRYAAALDEPFELTPQQATYCATRTLKEIATDYEATLPRDAPAPWLT